MNWKAIIPKPINAKIGSFKLSRQMRNSVLTSLHNELPEKAEHFRKFRVMGSDRQFVYLFNFEEGGIRHIFVAFVDDATAPGQLIVEDIAHSTNQPDA